MTYGHIRFNQKCGCILRDMILGMIYCLYSYCSQILAILYILHCKRTSESEIECIQPTSHILSIPVSCICLASHCPHQSKQDHGSQPLANSISLAVPQNPEDCPICALSLKEGVRAVGDSTNGEEEEEDAVKETGKEENHLEERGDGERKRKKKRTCFGYCKDIWNGMRRRLWGIVESKYFSRGIMIAILINTISMGIEHHNQVRWYSQCYHINIVTDTFYAVTICNFKKPNWREALIFYSLIVLFFRFGHIRLKSLLVFTLIGLICFCCYVLETQHILSVLHIKALKRFKAIMPWLSM